MSKPHLEKTMNSLKMPWKGNNCTVHGVFKFKKKLEFPETCSFSLTNLHRQLLGYTPTILHGAEADSLALMRITAVIWDKWLEWANINCILFSEMKQMWGTWNLWWSITLSLIILTIYSNPINWYFRKVELSMSNECLQIWYICDSFHLTSV